mmetsp:Transcript_110403/g.191397  ORF Transcript_110403/g.191397 Transcript_110403/m.191397 type:complete len:426 (+) Transcript_110403:89-1366(+)
MGSSASNSHAQIEVALERPQYHAGDMLTGYVQVVVQSQMSCTELYARFHGEVRTEVHYTTQRTYEERLPNGEVRTRTETEHRTAYDTQQLVEERRLVAYFPQKVVSPGLYQFPFQFMLHPSLVSSCLVPGHNNAGVFYGVEVQLHRPNIFKHDLVHRSFFDLVAHVPHPITPAILFDRKGVNCCCCISKGNVSLGAHLQQNAFRANEPIVVIIQFENASTAEVRHINVELKERIHFVAEGHCDTKLHTLASTFLPAVPPSEGFGDWNGTPPVQVQLQVPPVQHCSLRTTLLQVDHFVEIRAQTPFGITNPTIDLPVTLHRSPAVVSMMNAMTQHPANQVPLAPLAQYHLNPDALASPGEIQMQQPSAPVAPVGIDINQAFTGAPMPTQMVMQPGAPGARDLMEARVAPVGEVAAQPAPMQQPLMK